MPLDDPKEQFVQVDENDIVIGPIDRIRAHGNAQMIHRAVGILVENDNNEILLQKRSAKKDMYPGAWAISCAGHVTYGDSYDETATKELMEELGVRGKLSLIKKMYIEAEHESEFVTIYKMSLDETPIDFDLDEIEEIMWVKKDGLDIFVNNNEMTPFAVVVFKDLNYIDEDEK